MTPVHIFIKDGEDILPTLEEITNLYLYGQVEKPKNMPDPSTWAKYGGGSIAKIDLTLYMEQVGKYVNAASFDFIRIFMGLDCV